MGTSAKALTMAAAFFMLLTSTQAATLRVGMQDDPDALDPATSGTYMARFIFSAMCDKLVDISPDLKVVPQLATSWEWSADSKTLTFKLREGVKFHDGTPFDAEAVKFDIERYKTMPESTRKADFATVSNAEVLGPLEVRLNLSKPYAPLLLALTDRPGMMVSPTAAKALGANFGSAPVCAGPYKFVKRAARDFVQVEKDPGYWNATAYAYDQILYQYIEDSTVRLARLRAGDIDVIERVAPTDLAQIKSDTKLKLETIAGFAFSHLMVNFNNGEKAKSKLSSDARLREAFNLSIDRNVINRVAFAGQFTADNQMMPPSSPYYDQAHPMPARDIAKAKDLITKAGGGRIPVEITFANALTDARVGQIVQSMAAEAGFDVKLVPLESATAVERYFAGNFEVFIGNWGGRADPDGNIYPFLACDGAQNMGKYCNPELDKVLNAGRSEPDSTKRKAIYDQAAAIYLSDYPLLPLYHPSWFFATRAEVSGIKMYPDGLLRLEGVKPTK